MEFKQYKDYVNYLVGSDGFIYKILKHNRGLRKLKGMLNSGGYRAVQLFRPDGKLVKGERWLIHRLVATCFIPNPDNKPFVDHINGDKTDNRVENLRWVTAKENNSNPNTKDKSPSALRKRYSKPLLCVKEGMEIKFDNQYIASQFFNCDRSRFLSALKNGETLYGFSISQMEEWNKLN